MAKPTVRRFLTFDASEDYTININWNGSVSANRVIIYDPDTNNPVYDKTVQTTRLDHVVSASGSALENGHRYYISATVTNASGQESEPSDYIFFTCYTTPVLTFENTVAEGILRSANLSLPINMTYTQAEGRGIRTCQFILRDQNFNILTKSDMFYDGTTSYTFKGLTDDTSYVVEATVETVDNVVVTKYIEARVNTRSKSKYFIIKLENDPKHGYIRYSTNVIRIEYHGDEEFEYINGKIDLRLKELYYDNGFDVSGDWTLIADFELLPIPTRRPFIELRNDTSQIQISVVQDQFQTYHEDELAGDFSFDDVELVPEEVDFEDATKWYGEVLTTEEPDVIQYWERVDHKGAYRLKLVANSPTGRYIIFSKPVWDLPDDWSGSIRVRRINGLYDMYVVGATTLEIDTLATEDPEEMVVELDETIAPTVAIEDLEILGGEYPTTFTI